jgi:hypothetical protein
MTVCILIILIGVVVIICVKTKYFKNKGQRKIEPIMIEDNNRNKEVIQNFQDNGAHIYYMPGE